MFTSTFCNSIWSFNIFDIHLQVEWMDEETRIAALKKIEGMKSIVAYPDEFINDSLIEKYYNNLEMIPDQYYQNSLKISRLYMNHTISQLREPIIGRGDWTIHYITTVNAFYRFQLNTIGNEKIINNVEHDNN